MGRKAALGGAISGGLTAYSVGTQISGVGAPFFNIPIMALGAIVGVVAAVGAESYAAGQTALLASRVRGIAYTVGTALPAVSLVLAGMSGALFAKKTDQDLTDLVLHAESPTKVAVGNETAKALQALGVNVSAGQYEVNVSGDHSFSLGGQFVPAEKAQAVLGKLFKKDPSKVLVLPGASGHLEFNGDAARAAGQAAGIGNVSALSVLEHVADGKASGAFAAEGRAGTLNASQVARVNDAFDNGKVDGSYARVSGKLNIGTPQNFADYVNVLAFAQGAPYHFTLEEVFGHTPSEIFNMSAGRVVGNDTFQQGGWSAVDLMKVSLAAKGADLANLSANLSAIRNNANLTDAQKQAEAVKYLVQVDYQLGHDSVTPADSMTGFKDALWNLRSSYLQVLGVGSRAALDSKSSSALVNLSYETGILQQWNTEAGNVSTYKLQELQSLGRANDIAVAGLTASQLEALLPADALVDYLEGHGVAVPENQKANKSYLGEQVDGLVSARYLQGFKDFAGRLGLDSPASLDDLVAKVSEWNNASDRMAYNQGAADMMQARNEILYLQERTASYLAGLSDNAQASRELAAWGQAQSNIESLVQAHLLPNYTSNPWQQVKLDNGTNTSALRDIAGEKYDANRTLSNATVDYIIDFANAETDWTVRVYNTTGNTSYLVRGWTVDGQFVRADKGVVITDREFTALSSILGRYTK
ncbi:MAG: hypothetical protein HY438_02475 [DPANN group archaeon]|nr:hypothetical protein [DPANN group archaeon]